MVQQGGMSNTDAEQELKVTTSSLVSPSQFLCSHILTSYRALYQETRMKSFSSASESTTIMKKRSIKRAVLSIAR
jgi:hypothetical protein